ncbi:hypothetical protein [uncultured Bacteroides sp.]|jgi:hypothetical protein|uniref:hypothetical protein n=1 Tax=uncultured Bacteroides sp. TaxID=162156 RepID=UPI00206DD495|nr:hypothetical protein [uncultured Bacteroides sp.]DAR50015.1 MAG TPA: hypothetical protein [Caudoviricetes sp.]
MAINLSTGIYGFICSVTKKAGEYVSTFVSGVSGWIIRHNGDAEFKSIYARDKIVTNEYVYNRIRVTEDEEIVSSNGKIDYAINNGDGTYTVGLDLREGDINPFADGDLLIGYYHNPENSEVIYAIQRITVMQDPKVEDQSMIVVCEDGSFPHKYMIVVRVGNLRNSERQAFVKISSRTNSVHFFEGIDSWAALDNPDNIRCSLGKADLGLIPSWATDAIGDLKKWFGLIADGVILRGTFILKNDKTIEDELTGQITELSGRFEIRETGITGKWKEVIKYAEQASQSAGSAAGSATAAGEHEKKVVELAGEFSVNAKKLAADFSEKVTTETSSALGAIASATETATGSLQLTARDFSVAFTKLVNEKTTEATGTITNVKESAESSITQTAEKLDLSFKKTVETKTAEATGAITDAKELAESSIQASAEALKIDFNKNVEKKTNEANGAITDMKNKATSDFEITAKKLTTTFEETVSSKTTEATGAIKDTTDTHKSELSRTAKELTDKFQETLTDAEGNIIKEIGTQVTQNAKQWKVEVMGKDAEGNPNTILAAINADESGIKIKGDKVEIDGTLFAQMIMASGLNVNDKTIITKEGLFKTVDAIIEGSIAQSFKNLGTLRGNVTLDFSTGFNWAGETSSNIIMFLPFDAPHGTFCAIFNGGPRRLTGTITVMQLSSTCFIDKRYLDNPEQAVTKIKLRRNQMLELRFINAGTATAWRIMNYDDFSLSQEGGSWVLS